MSKIIDWLGTRFSGTSAPVEADVRNNPVESREPPESAQAQDNDDDQETASQPGLGIQEDANPEYSRDKGFDPYNTGPLDVSKMKESSSDE